MLWTKSILFILLTLDLQGKMMKNDFSKDEALTVLILSYHFIHANTRSSTVRIEADVVDAERLGLKNPITMMSYADSKAFYLKVHSKYHVHLKQKSRFKDAYELGDIVEYER